MTYTGPSMPDIEKTIHERYPDLENVFKPIAELWGILIWSVAQGGAGLSRTQIQAAMQNTNWYRTHNEAQQSWYVLKATNPAEAVSRQKKAQNDVLLAGIRMGAKLTLGQIGYIADQWLENGWTTAELNDQLIGYTSRLKPAQRAPGEFGAAITKVRALADEYAMPLANRDAEGLAKELMMTGSKGDAPGQNESSLRDILAQRAKSLYPSLRRELEAGVTVRQWAAPYIQVAAQELGVAPESVTFNDPKWKAMLEGVKSKDGHDPLTLADWQTRLRTDARYGYDKTVGGKQVAAGLANGIAQLFGNQG